MSADRTVGASASDAFGRLAAALEGRYRIERELGEGGMATVYLAHDLRHDRRVAIKVLRPELAAVIGAERFLAEIKTTAKLQHPHILPLFDSGEADRFLFYVMPLVEGDSLADRLSREKQLPVDEAVRITKAVAGALDYAHRHGVIHRDIKPANILLHDGQPVVADFGIALAVSAAGGGRLTETGLSVGTPAYMSPEQATADQDPGPQADVYSLACVLYELLAGEPPFTGSSAQAILAKIVTSVPTLPTEHRPAVPAHVEAALLKALEKLPADRFRTAEDFAKALDDTAITHPRQGAVPGRVGAREPWLRRRASQAAVAVIIGLAVWGWYAALKLTVPRPVPPVTRLPFQEAPGTNDIVLGNDGRWVAEGDGTRTVTLRHLNDGTVRKIDIGGPGGPLASSPDGRFLLVGLFNGGMERIPVDEGAPIPVLGHTTVWGADWGDDGRIVYTDPTGMYLIRVSGGSPTKVLDETAWTAWDPRFVPGGRYAVFTKGHAGSQKGEIQVLDLRTHQTRKLLDGMTPRYVAPGYLLYVEDNHGLFAVPFDVRDAEVTGPPRQVMDSLVLVAGVPGAEYDVSDAGTALFRRGATDDDRASNQERFVLVSESGREEVLPVPAGMLGGGRLTSEGRFLAYQRAVRVYVYDRLTGLNRPVSPVDMPAGWPFWSRDETHLVFDAEADGVNTAVSMAADGKGPPHVLADPRKLGVAGFTPTSVGPNDTTVLVMLSGMQNEGPRDLGTLELGTDTTYVPYLQADWKERQASLSPDGRWVAYLSDETGTDRLYVRSYPVPGKRHDVSPPGQAVPTHQVPVWARDGHALYWKASGDSVMKADVTLKPDFSSRPARLLFRTTDTGPSDVTADGRLLMIKQPPADSAAAAGSAGRRPTRSTILIVNWLDNLRARMKGEGGS